MTALRHATRAPRGAGVSVLRRATLAVPLLWAGGCQFPSFTLHEGQGGEDGSGGVAGVTTAGAAMGGAVAGDTLGGSSGGALAGLGGLGGGSGTASAAGSEPIGGGSEQGGAAGAGGDGNPPASTCVLFEDFNDGFADGWFETTSDWAVSKDATGEHYGVSLIHDSSLFSAAGTNMGDVRIEAKVRIDKWGSTAISNQVALFARYVNVDEHYYVALRRDGKLAIRKKIAGTNTTLGAPVNVAAQTGIWYDLRLDIIGTTLIAYLNGVERARVTDSDIAMGRVALGTDNAAGQFDDVCVSKP